MKMTDSERLIAMMLAEVLERLGGDHDLDPAFIKTVLQKDAAWAIPWKYPIFESDEQPETVTETTNILSMYRVIEASIDSFDEPDRSEIAVLPYATFKGFDGNNDPHGYIARTMIEDLESFDEFAGRDLNSHSQATLPRYRQMWQRFDRIIGDNMGEFTPAEIREIIG